MSNNPRLGDEGMAALAAVLPASLEELHIGSTGCGDDAFVALAAALPALTRLRVLRCEYNPAARSRGWVALAGALPALPSLEHLDADGCSGRRPDRV